jgi:hypothetical protein
MYRVPQPLAHRRPGRLAAEQSNIAGAASVLLIGQRVEKAVKMVQEGTAARPVERERRSTSTCWCSSRERGLSRALASVPAVQRIRRVLVHGVASTQLTKALPHHFGSRACAGITM